ncbi:MAG: amino acid dehydrogenase [Legionellales bacterium]|nr:amino acid dehydrogenase [Legionellales bacterium]|tara:strand:- start:668 stop:1732 length:1065 start_codon:yes stop_codon:yes gene_type:complete
MTQDPSKYLKALGYGKIYVHRDPELDFTAIVALHSTALGPAIGGCRCIQYDHFDTALNDALQLGHAMTLKAAMHELPHGGGKSVLMIPEHCDSKQRDLILKSFGNFLNELNGTYITAVDSGTQPQDMDVIATQTPYVLADTHLKSTCNPSYYTAQGVRYAMEALIEHKGYGSFSNVTIALQGLGAVGLYLCEILLDLGAHIIATDTDPLRCEQASKTFNINIVEPEDIYAIQANIFAPCALGGTLNARTIPLLKADSIVGSANNPCDTSDHTEQLFKAQEITYVPDYLANGGGLIHVAGLYANLDSSWVDDKIKNIYTRTQQLLSQAAQQHQSMEYLAREFAYHVLQRSHQPHT